MLVPLTRVHTRMQMFLLLKNACIWLPQLIVREVERERMMHGLVGRLESCTDRFEAIKPSLPETSGSSSRKRHRGGKEEEILSLSKAGGQGASGSKRQKGKEWRGGSISPIQQAEDETQAILEMPNCDDIGCIGLSLLHDRGAGRITVGRIIKGGTVDRCKIAISLGDFVVAVDSIKLTTGAEADTVQVNVSPCKISLAKRKS